MVGNVDSDTLIGSGNQLSGITKQLREEHMR